MAASVVLRAHVTIHLEALKPQTLPPEMCFRAAEA